MKNMKKRYVYKLALGVIVLLAGIVSATFYEHDASFSSFLISMGLVLFIVTAFRFFRQGDLPDRDERTKKLAAYGITYSWLLTLLLISVLYLANFFKLVDFTAESVLGILLIFMTISANIFRWYFTQKGDIE
jgi:drug/metabolite transporter (DMT)-like permease